MAVRTKRTFCWFCHANCAMLADVEDGKIVAVYDDPEFGGYTCIKGRQLPDSHNAAHRLTAAWSVARMARSSKPRWPRRWLMSEKRSRRSSPSTIPMPWRSSWVRADTRTAPRGRHRTASPRRSVRATSTSPQSGPRRPVAGHRARHLGHARPARQGLYDAALWASRWVGQHLLRSRRGGSRDRNCPREFQPDSPAKSRGGRGSTARRTRSCAPGGGGWQENRRCPVRAPSDSRSNIGALRLHPEEPSITANSPPNSINPG